MENSYYVDCSNNYKQEIAFKDLFLKGKDDIMLEGTLWKFKPGLTANFIERYTQISSRTFRYFENYLRSMSGSKPIVCFRKTIILKCVPVEISKKSYLKPGSKAFKDGFESKLFDNMLEIILVDDYENHCHYNEQYSDEYNKSHS